jgi:hypothetical protein
LGKQENAKNLEKKPDKRDLAYPACQHDGKVDDSFLCKQRSDQKFRLLTIHTSLAVCYAMGDGI